MAERRMFAKTIVLSDAFLDMPMSTRCLYFTLGMLADDDGFVNSPKSIIRQIGATADDLRVLLAKKFVLEFDDGVLVIKHWRINNYLRNDRYSPTKYEDHRADLELDENGAYRQRYTNGIPSGIPTVDQRYTEDRLGKDRVGYITPPIVPPTGGDAGGSKDLVRERFDAFWGEYPRKTGKGDAEKVWMRLKPNEELFNTILGALRAIKETAQWKREGGRFVPLPATWLNGKRWEDDPNAVRAGSPNAKHDNIPPTYDIDEFYQKALDASYGRKKDG